jgi:hypothetical protein
VNEIADAELAGTPKGLRDRDKAALAGLLG